MAVRTLIVNTMPTGRSDDRTGEEGGILSTMNHDPTDRPDHYLDYETRGRIQRPGKLSSSIKTDDVPEGMEGCYYLP